MRARHLSHSEEETAQIAARLAQGLPPGSVLLLYGELGAGKTAFVRGVVAGRGVSPDEVSSPTFTLIQEYGGGRIFHVDLYRLGPEEVDDLGLDELCDGDGLVCIEWADRLPRPLPGAVAVQIDDRGGETRAIVVSGETGAPGP